MQKRNLILLAVAVAIGLIAVFLANSWFSGMQEKQQITAQHQEITKVVVASAPLEFGGKLTAMNVRLQDWPAASVPAGAFRTTADAMKNDRVALRSMVPGEPVLASNVSGTDGRATLASMLLPGMRAVSVAINDVRGVSGFVLPGTMVDVLLTRRIEGAGSQTDDQRSDVLLQNVRVLAIDQLANEKQSDPKVARTATLAVSLHDAQRLAVAEKVGVLSLALRKLEDSTNADPSGAQLVTSRGLAGPRIAIPASRSATFAPSYAASTGGITPPAIPTFGTAGGAAGYVPAHTGPSMTIVRGIQATSYPISQADSHKRGR